MSTDYEKGYKQFAEMVGEDNIESLVSRFDLFARILRRK